MSNLVIDPQYFSQIDVLPYSSDSSVPDTKLHSDAELCSLMRQVVSAQQRHTELLEVMVSSVTLPHRHRLVELALWKKSNPELANFCKRAAAKLERVQSDLLASITEEVEYNGDLLLDSEFGLSEFLDRFGTKFSQLTGLLQVLGQLGNAPDIHLPPAENDNEGGQQHGNQTHSAKR